MTEKHKVFVSYHHANDQRYREYFENLCKDVIVSWSVDIGDIDSYLKTETIRQKIRDEYLKESTVTVVLVGNETWQRKHVDWEISSSIRDTKNSSRSGLMGIILPTYDRPSPGQYYPKTIPPRLYDNIECGYAKIYGWSEDPDIISSHIHDAYLGRTKFNPDNSRDLFSRNHSGSSWQ